MSLTLRRFRNTDVDALCRVWNAHFADHGYESRIDPLRLELSCLAKPYFESQDLVLAELAEQVVGFMHVGQLANSDFSGPAADSTAISALCVEPCQLEADVAQALLAHADEISRARGAAHCHFRPMFPNAAFYLGLGPADSMMGVTSHEHRVCVWLNEAGYRPFAATSQWELELATFQPPVDRLQIQIRRSAHVDRQVDEPRMPWWQACLLGHTEPTAFQLTHRTARVVLNEVLLWVVAPELQTSPDNVAWLWPLNLTASVLPMPAEVADSQAKDQLVFLLAETLRALRDDNIELVRTVSAADDPLASQVLKRLGFRARQSGVVFAKELQGA